MSGKFVVNFDTESRLITLGPFENFQLLEVSEKLYDLGYALADKRNSVIREHSYVYVTNYCSQKEITWKTFEELKPELLSRNSSSCELVDAIEEAWIPKYEVCVNIYSPCVSRMKYFIEGNEFLPRLVCLFDTGCSVTNKLTFNGKVILDKLLPSTRKVDVSIRPCLKSALHLSSYENIVRGLLETTFFPSVEIKKYAVSILVVPCSKRVYIGPFATTEEAEDAETLLESSLTSCHSMDIEEVTTTCDYPTVDSYLV